MPVYGVAAYTDGRSPSIEAELHDPEQVFLNGASPLLNPCLIARGAEELRWLQDSPFLVVDHIRHCFQKEGRTRTKVGIEYREKTV